ncbi:C-GCAxxG-C-C family protein [Bacteroidota bacterium]
MAKKETASALHEQGYACSQAVLATFADDLGIDKETAYKISATFGGGIGRTGETCGALTGAIMVLGLKYGSAELPDDLSKKELYETVSYFLDEFKEKHSTTLCKDLLGYDISIPEEYEKVKENGISNKKCPVFISDAVEILEDMLI